jgi:hypothetical protein
MLWLLVIVVWDVKAWNLKLVSGVLCSKGSWKYSRSDL